MNTTFMAKNGTTKSMSVGSRKEVWNLVFKNTSDEKTDDLHYFFNHPNINWGEKTFRWKDHNSTFRNVKLLNTDLNMPMTTGGVTSINMTLREV
jgi:hypothetical protein